MKKRYLDVSVEVKNSHHHNIKSNFKLQIQGNDRTDVAKDIILSHRGSSKKYRQALIAKKARAIPTEETLRQIKHEYMDEFKIEANVQPHRLCTVHTERKYIFF
jgi:hypothetical protein